MITLKKVISRPLLHKSSKFKWWNMGWETKQYANSLLLLMGIFLVSLAGRAHAQPQMQVDAITAGGNIATSSNYTVISTVGQVAVTSASSTNISLTAGIWPSIFNVNKLTSIDPENPKQDLPDKFSLDPAYPNPFNPTTRIQYALPEAVKVRLTVYNMLGQQVKVLVNKKQKAGRHAVTFHSSQISSGIYIYRLEAGNFVKVRKMTLVK